MPSDWNVAHVTPIYKKSNKSYHSNYRPISLTCIVWNILEYVVYSSVIKFLDDNNILPDFQHGFRQRRSCETQLTNTLSDFSNCLDKSSQVDAILLDFSNAFDKVDHFTLILNVSDYGIRGNLLNWSVSFLLGRIKLLLTAHLPTPALCSLESPRALSWVLSSF